jgi:hypothetical protein
VEGNQGKTKAVDLPETAVESSLIGEFPCQNSDSLTVNVRPGFDTHILKPGGPFLTQTPRETDFITVDPAAAPVIPFIHGNTSPLIFCLLLPNR